MIINVNNVNLYYEVYGEGKPIIMLHGNGESHKIFKKVTEKLKNDFKVYLIDSRAQGQSEKTKEISYNLMALDVIEFIKKLEIEKPILYGFSDGGIIGLLIAIKEPSLLSKLIISGANLEPKGMTRSMVAIIKLGYFFTRNKLYKMMLTEPNITKEDLGKIEVPTFVFAGKKDVIREEHTRFIAENIKNSTLKILEKENHGSYVVNTLKLYETIKEYIYWNVSFSVN